MDFTLQAMLAILAGLVVSVALFVPFVFISYRTHGHMSLRRGALWAAAAIYGWAIWTYTLLPLPDPGSYTCARRNLNPLEFLDDLNGAWARSAGQWRTFVTDFAVLQLALNVLLFMPLGFFTRVLWRRGVIEATFFGMALSTFVEFTQLTGVWGIYDCAYRVFDVDDILTNTTGALLGSLVALLVPRRWTAGGDGSPAHLPRPVTRRRRLLAMLTDWMAFEIVSVGAAVTIQAWYVYINDSQGPQPRADQLAAAGTAALTAVIVLTTGRTLGDLAVQLEYRGGPLPTALRRLARLLAGVGGYGLLQLIPDAGPALAGLFAVIAVVVALATTAGSGLPGALTRAQLTDARQDGGGA